jgi:hypothetical protein
MEFSLSFALFTDPFPPFLGGVEPSRLLLRPGLLYLHLMMDDDECGAVGGITARGN